MSKKPKAQWGEFAFIDVKNDDLLVLSDAQASDLLQSIGVSVSAQSDRLRQELRNISLEYLSAKRLDEATPCLADQRTALKKIEKSAKALETDVRFLDFKSIELLERFLDNNHPSIFGEEDANGHELLSGFRMRLEHFTEVLSKLVDQTATIRGRSQDEIVRSAVFKIAALYELMTTKQATHTPRVKLEYDGVPNSQAGKFIVACMVLIDERVPRQSIASDLSEYIKER